MLFRLVFRSGQSTHRPTHRLADRSGIDRHIWNRPWRGPVRRCQTADICPDWPLRNSTQYQLYLAICFVVYWYLLWVRLGIFSVETHQLKPKSWREIKDAWTLNVFIRTQYCYWSFLSPKAPRTPSPLLHAPRKHQFSTIVSKLFLI